MSGFGGLLNAAGGAGGGGGLSNSSSATSGNEAGNITGGDTIFNLGRGSSGGQSQSGPINQNMVYAAFAAVVLLGLASVAKK